MQLGRWSNFIREIDSISGGNTTFIFDFHYSNKAAIINLVKKAGFIYPICIDEEGLFDKANHFPSNIMSQTFLLDKNKNVLVIGNPVYNPNIKDLYIGVIKDKQYNIKDINRTIVKADKYLIDLGNFPWEKEITTSFVLYNIGTSPLYIKDVITSCDCTTCKYPMNPIEVGDSAKLYITYKANIPEEFVEDIAVYCNVDSKMVRLKIMGNAKE